MSTAAQFPGFGRLLARGIARRCPRCGSGHLFRRYFTIVSDCARCRLHFEREPGYWTGALAINIAVMGLILVEGIRRSLPDAIATAFDRPQLQALASSIAAGNLGSLRETYPVLALHDPSGAGAHAALVRGFGWVMLYGGISAGILAAISFLIFGAVRRPAHVGAAVACAESDA